MDNILLTTNNNNNNNNSNNNNSGTYNKNISIVVPYTHGLWEGFKRKCNSRGIQVHFKGTNTIKILLMFSKDRDSKLQKSGVIYKFKCPHINCLDEYIGESGRTFVDRLKEQLMASSTTIVTPQDTQSALNVLQLWTWSQKEHQGG